MKLLSKLTPQTANLSGIVGMSSNRSAMLNGAEFAAILKNLDKLETLSVYAIDLLDPMAKTQLKAHIWALMSEKYKDEITHAKRHETLFKLVHGIVAMLVKSPTGGVCRCGGEEDCPKCHGTEIRKHSMYELERHTSVTTATLYKEPVKSWIDEILDMVLVARSNAHHKIKNNYWEQENE